MEPSYSSIEAEQQDLLRRLAELETERSRLQQRRDEIDEQVEAARTRLRDIQNQLLRDLLDDKLAPMLLAYTVNPSGSISVFALPGGEASYAQYVAVVQNPDDASVNEVLNFIGASAPWVSYV